MRRRLGWLFATAAVLVLAPASAVAEAPPLTAAINAVDFAFVNPATGERRAVIAPGGSVDFAYPSGGSTHNVAFTGAAPTSCSQTAGANSGPVPPLPAVPTAAGWAGACAFATEGTFTFVCQLHGSMKGSVVVSSTIPPPEETGGPGGGSGGGSQGGGGAGGGAVGSLGPAASQLVIARIQTGALVRGSIGIARDGSRLRVDLLARRSALGGKGAKQLAIGRSTKTFAAGKRSFAVKLNAVAVAVLAERGQLALTVRVAVDPSDGATFTVTRPATLKAPSKQKSRAAV